MPRRLRHARISPSSASPTLWRRQRQRVAAECGCRAVADYHDLIGEIDAAVVAAPTGLHHQIGMELLAGGIHVLMEKPLAPTAEDAKELVDAAEAEPGRASGGPRGAIQSGLHGFGGPSA